MSYIYAISDIHGCFQPFLDALEFVDLSGDNKLVLLGDYIHGRQEENYKVLDKIISLEREYGTDKVISLAGNHEEMVCTGRFSISEDMNNDDNEDRYIIWMQELRKYYIYENNIFVHAGVDEDRGDMWEWTDDYTFTEKYPATLGKFECDNADMKIIAGHIGTAEIAENPRFNGIYYDGESHFYIDATTLDSGVVNVLKIDTENNKYYYVTETGDRLILPYDEEF